MPSNRLTFTAVAYLVTATLTGGAAAYVYLDHSWKRSFQVANSEYNASIAELSARSLARLRTGSSDEAIAFLEDRVDSYLVGVPMGKRHRELTPRAQEAMSMVKTYRAQYPFRGECTQHAQDLHATHVPEILNDVPVLPADHQWLDLHMRKIAEIQRSPRQP